MKTFDLAFIGLGAASLSLATRLANNGYGGSAVFIDPAPEAVDERTWCGWGLIDHPYQAALTRQWHCWRVGSAAAMSRSGHPDIPYEMLRGSAVRRLSMQSIASRRDWEVLTPAAVMAEKREQGTWCLELDDGSTVQAKMVLDSRPPRLSLQRPWLWQSFYGIEIKGEDFGADDCVNLMELVEDDAPLVNFFYELPITRDQRLIEFTRFTPEKPDMEDLKARVEQRLAERGWQQAQVVRTEQGHLPMAPIAAQTHEQWIAIGTAGGSMRPATGYAFHAIQSWADEAAGQLMAGTPPSPPSRSRILDWLDGVFLESLWLEPEAAAGRYRQLFEKTPPAALTRFLMSRPRPIDILKVLLALPVSPMLRAAWHHGWRRS